MDERISLRQQQFLDFVAGYNERNGRSPTYKEIAIGLGISSKGSVSAMVKMLEEMKLIEREPKAYRGVRIRHPVHGPQ